MICRLEHTSCLVVGWTRVALQPQPQCKAFVCSWQGVSTDVITDTKFSWQITHRFFSTLKSVSENRCTRNRPQNFCGAFDVWCGRCARLCWACEILRDADKKVWGKAIVTRGSWIVSSSRPGGQASRPSFLSFSTIALSQSRAKAVEFFFAKRKNFPPYLACDTLWASEQRGEAGEDTLYYEFPGPRRSGAFKPWHVGCCETRHHWSAPTSLKVEEGLHGPRKHKDWNTP